MILATARDLRLDLSVTGMFVLDLVLALIRKLTLLFQTSSKQVIIILHGNNAKQNREKRRERKLEILFVE